MHNSVPQMGYYHHGLGTYIYNDDRSGQMGFSFSDMFDALKDTGTSLIKSEQSKDALKNLINTGNLDISQLKDLAPQTLLTQLEEVPGVLQLEQKMAEYGFQAKIDQTKTYVKENKNTVIFAGIALVIGVGALIYLMRKK